jgi:formylmethanofuran dehydrogenase subunit A
MTTKGERINIAMIASSGIPIYGDTWKIIKYKVDRAITIAGFFISAILKGKKLFPIKPQQLTCQI